MSDDKYYQRLESLFSQPESQPQPAAPAPAVPPASTASTSLGAGPAAPVAPLAPPAEPAEVAALRAEVEAAHRQAQEERTQREVMSGRLSQMEAQLTTLALRMLEAQTQAAGTRQPVAPAEAAAPPPTPALAVEVQPQQPPQAPSLLQRGWDAIAPAWLRRLLTPPVFTDDDDKTRQISTLNYFLLAAIVGLVIIAGSQYAIPDFRSGTVLVGLAVVMGLALWLARRGRILLAGWLATLAAGGVVIYLMLSGGGFFDTSSWGLPALIILSSLLVNRRAPFYVAAVAIAISLALGLAEMNGLSVKGMSQFVNTENLVIRSVMFLLMAVMLERLMASQAGVVERVRQNQAELEVSNRELRDLQVSLAQRVMERTRDLQLASEVGRSLSQVRDLGTLLSEAVKLIRTRFDLYYAQVYLLDPTGRTLALRAGTGSVGEELLRRGHRLAVGPGSINGRAASERRAVVISDTSASATFRPNTLLPDTRSEMAVPLLLGDQVVGVLDMQSSRAGALTEDNLPAFEALAGQLAVAVQNASLFAQTEQARADVEEQARRLTQTGWQTFLDAVERSERLGYTFDQTSVRPLAESLPAQPGETTLTVPIVVGGETLGQLQVESGEEQTWTPEDVVLAQTVARQVAQQIESLRLIAQAERSRREAEALSRAATRQSWEGYLESNPATRQGFVYDQEQVLPLGQAPLEPAAVSHPLKVREEIIGELAVAGVEQLPPEQADLVEAVAARLSTHIESLRLTEEAQARVAELGAINELSQLMTSQQQDLDALISVVGDKVCQTFNVDSGYIALYDDQTNLIQFPYYQDQGQRLQTQSRPLGQGLTSVVIHSHQPLLLVEDTERRALQMGAIQTGTSGIPKSWLGVPMLIGERVIGVVNVQDLEREQAFSPDDVRLLTTIAAAVATAVQNNRLFAETQKRARRETLINTITQRIQGTTTVDSALQTALQELGQALRAQRASVELKVEAGNGGAAA